MHDFFWKEVLDRETRQMTKILEQAMRPFADPSYIEAYIPQMEWFGAERRRKKPSSVNITHFGDIVCLIDVTDIRHPVFTYPSQKPDKKKRTEADYRRIIETAYQNYLSKAYSEKE